MGRKKIQIARIVDERNRHVTFTKRKFGLMKKAYELSVLCDCEIALIIFNGGNKLFQYASTDMDKVLLKYTEYNEPHESRTNADIVDTLRKKGLSGSDMEADDSAGQSPDTDDKYPKMADDVDLMLNRQRLCALPTYDLGVDASPLLYSHDAGDRGLLAVQQRMSPRRPADAGQLGPEPLNGAYGDRCTSPATASPSRSIRDKIPPVSGGSGREPDLRPLMPPTIVSVNKKTARMRVLFKPLTPGCVLLTNALWCEDFDLLSNARLNRSQSAQTLSSPSGFPSSLSSYDADFSLGGELSSLTAFGSVGGWQRHEHVHDLQNLPLSHMGNVNATLNFPPGQQNLRIKSEPASPIRERGAASAVCPGRAGDYVPRPPSEGDGPSIKRVRLTEGWAA
ncbi:myocyte-specific enhancer factor 2C-like isoform X1 [Corythoichthys intestinalis]|uniref:myocyte-specific enhancer factor 2C-like isoform X1 n=1 Tax=Corythoichthys intestinalis TaxID=161448 RepID=UPI0025A67CE0|nr:myocyte-specific enhancer factor 2C-like isoform X1 [Corythoichthys intestinalis]XP_061800142.1 myocyte-specific enhancer factor 2C-like [Nerophis lumbriciformis]